MKKVKRLFGSLRKNYEWSTKAMYAMPYAK